MLRANRPGEPAMSVVRSTVLLLVLGLAAPVAAQEASPPPVTPAAGFKLLDANGDGVVSRFEYDGDIFSALDADRDQRLSPDELDAVLGQLAKDGPTASERIVVADLDRDGQLDENELRGAAEMRFASMDRDGDGNLDEAEFATGFGVRVR